MAQWLAVEEEVITAQAQFEHDRAGIMGAGPVRFRKTGHARARRE